MAKLTKKAKSLQGKVDSMKLYTIAGSARSMGIIVEGV